MRSCLVKTLQSWEGEVQIFSSEGCENMSKQSFERLAL